MYFKLAPLLVPFFMLTTVVFFVICVYRGEIILGLQSKLLTDKDQEIRVVVEQHESANNISKAYEQRQADREQEKIYVTNTIEKIVSVPSYSNLCFDPTGLQFLNGQVAAANSSSELSSALPSDKESN